MVNYKLVNPYISGTLDTEVEAKNPLEAAEMLWTRYSSLTTNNVPNFAFTIQSGGRLHHFKVHETKKSDDTAKFTIEKIDAKKDVDISEFKKVISEKSSAHGGARKKRYDDEEDDSSDSDSSDVFDNIKLQRNLHMNKPVVYWWYTPYIYDVPSVYMPTFVHPIVPYLEIAPGPTFHYY